MSIRIIPVFVFCFNLLSAQPPLTLHFSTFVGGTGYDQVRDVTTDCHGNIYITGGTSSANFQVTGQQTLNTKGQRIMDIFIMKYAASGELLWSRLLGGDEYDRAYAIEVDDTGNVYIAGRAGKNLPVSQGVFQPVFMDDLNPNPLYGKQDGFIAKLSTNGTLIWCSYFGGSDRGFIRDIALDKSGNIFIVQTETSGKNPHIAPNAFQKANNGAYDAVIAKISNDGQQVIWATYLGGTKDDFFGPSIKVNSLGQAVVIGTVLSPDLPTTAPCLDSTLSGESDIFIAILNNSGDQLIFGSYLGGSSMEGTETHNLVLDRCDHIIIAATTASKDYPVTGNAFQRKYGGTGGAGLGERTNYPFDAFVTKLDKDGTKILASTFFGSKNGEAAEGVGVDYDGNIYITGATFSNDLFTGTASQTGNNGKGDAFMVKLDASLRAVSYFNYIGGTGVDFGRALCVNFRGDVYLAGETSSAGFPTSKSVYGNGGLDGFLVGFNSTTPISISDPCNLRHLYDPCK